ncbi:MAG: hypothetical protein GY861_19490 [bacterium]|nr:hypothetical protein [bacterium]
MAFTNFNEVFSSLESMGILDSLLPFFLIFTVIFAILQKTKIIGEGRKNFNVIIALIIALMVVIPHVADTYPSSPDPVEVINSAIPNISIVVVALLMLLLLIGVFGKDLNIVGTSLSGIIAVASFVIIIYIFGGAMEWWDGAVPNFLMNEETQSLLIIILVFGIIIWFITKDDSGGVNVGGGMGDFFRGMLKNVGPK